MSDRPRHELGFFGHPPEGSAFAGWEPSLPRSATGEDPAGITITDAMVKRMARNLHRWDLGNDRGFYAKDIAYESDARDLLEDVLNPDLDDDEGS